MASIKRCFVEVGIGDKTGKEFGNGSAKSSDNLYSKVDRMYKGVPILTSKDKKVNSASFRNAIA